MCLHTILQRKGILFNKLHHFEIYYMKDVIPFLIAISYAVTSTHYEWSIYYLIYYLLFKLMQQQFYYEYPSDKNEKIIYLSSSFLLLFLFDLVVLFYLALCLALTSLLLVILLQLLLCLLLFCLDLLFHLFLLLMLPLYKLFYGWGSCLLLLYVICGIFRICAVAACVIYVSRYVLMG